MRRSTKMGCFIASMVLPVLAMANTGNLTDAERATYQMTWALQIATRVRAHHVPRGVATKPTYVRVVLLPTGEVKAVTIKQSSGDAVYDESVVRAAFQSSPFPLPANPEAFDSRVTVCMPAELCPH